MVPVAQGVGGFALGALLTILTPPIGLAIALVLGGILAWARNRQGDVAALTPGALGYLLAVAAYVLLAVLVNL